MSAVGAASMSLLARPNVFEVDLGAVANNIQIVRRQVGDAWLCAALKADAYGYGLLETARTALDAGADAVAVGDVESGLLLRRRGLDARVLVYAGTRLSADAAAACAEHGLIATLHDESSLAAALACGADRLEVFVKVDTGLQR